MSKLSRAFGTAKLRAVHHGPTILTAVGIGALIASGVVAAVRTQKLEEALDVHDQTQEVVRTQYTSAVTTEEQYNRDLLKLYTTTAWNITKIYAPAIGLAAVGSASVLYSHGVMKRRNAALVAAYGVLERAYSAYRGRVQESIGEEAEDQIYRGHVVKAAKVDKEGVISYEPVKDGHLPVGTSEYSVEFGPENPHWNDRAEYNLFFLRGQERMLNFNLQANGHVMLNDVYDALRIPRTTAGAVVGWVYKGEGDGYIDFGLPEQGSAEEQDYYYFFDQNSHFVLDFNVDGLVFEKLDELRRG